jgi:hypothetical protein
MSKQETKTEKKEHILSITDDKGNPLIFIGKNFDQLNLEGKISVIKHLKKFVTEQKSHIIKLIEEI